MIRLIIILTVIVTIGNNILFATRLYDKHISKQLETVYYTTVCNDDSCIYHTIADALRNRAGTIKLKDGEWYRECLTLDTNGTAIIGNPEAYDDDKGEQPHIRCPWKQAKTLNHNTIFLMTHDVKNIKITGLNPLENGAKDDGGWFIYQLKK